MATVAHLAVAVTAKVNKFIAGFKRAQKQLRAFAGAVARVAKRVALIGTAMVAVGTAIAAMQLRKAFKDLDLLAKTADQLGAVPERLQEMTLAANLAGASFEDLAKGLIYLQRRTAEVASGYGEAQTAFELLRLDAQKMINMPVEKQWAAFAKGIRETTNQTVAMRATMDVLGRSGAKLMNLLRMSNAEFEKTAQWMKRSGLLLSREQLRLIEQANDAVTQTILVLKLVWAQVAIRVAPAIKILADRFNNAAAQGKLFGEHLTAALDHVTRAAQATVKAILEIPLTLMKVQQFSLIARKTAVEKFPFMASFFYGGKGKAGVLQDYAKRIDELSAKMWKWVQASDTVAANMKALWTPAIAAMATEITNVADSFDDAAMALKMKLGEELDGILGKLRRMAQTAGKTADEIALMDMYTRGATEAQMGLAKMYIEAARIRKAEAKAIGASAAATGGLQAARGMTRFAEVSLSRQAVMGLNVRGLGGQLVRDPQLMETNRLLGQVAVNTRSIQGVL